MSVFLNTLDRPVSIPLGRKLGYALPVKTDYEELTNSEKHQVKECPCHANKDSVLKRVNELKLIRIDKLNLLIKCFR